MRCNPISCLHRIKCFNKIGNQKEHGAYGVKKNVIARQLLCYGSGEHVLFERCKCDL